MDSTRHRLAAQILRRYRSGQMPRREALRLLGALGLTTAGVGVIGAGAFTARARTAPSRSTQGDGGHGGWNAALLRQDAATPAPVATPAPGEQPDETYLWRVQAAARDEVALVEAMVFFPGEITINVGDAIFFDFGHRPFHTVTFPSGQEPPKVVVPDETVGTPTTATPAVEAPLPRLMVNPVAAFPAGGSTYDGTGYLNSGLSGPSAPPYVLTFTAPGTYEYLCLFHPVPMKGTVTVQEQGAAYPHDQAAYDQTGAEQAARLLDEGHALIAQHEAAATPAPATDGTTVWEVAAGVGGERVEVDRFLPGELTISVGDTVRWTNRSRHLPHTVTFLGGGEPPEVILIEPQEGGPPKLALNPLVAAPAGRPAYDGQGYVNSGYLGRELPEFYEEFPRNPTYELTFITPGQYRYYCAIHAGGPDDEQGMTGTITVS